MKKLTVFFIKSFVGPFFATFFVSIFMLVMQFLWKYIDDLMGKGLEVSIILELLFYVSASLIPLALPLAILLSSLIVLGNLGENIELTALKSSGLSIFKILRPLTGIIVLVAIGTFYFSNYVIPIANYKWHSIIWDIQEKKMTSFLKPGVYSKEIENFSIKVKEKKDNKFKQIIIHDRHEPTEIKTIVADSGEMYQSVNGEFLFFKLYHGSVIEELASTPDFEKGTGKKEKNIFPSRKSNFNSATYKMDLTGFQLQRTKDDLFKNNFEMLNVFQINQVSDSMKKVYNDLVTNLKGTNLSKHPYFQEIEFLNRNKSDSLEQIITEAKTARLSDSISDSLATTQPTYFQPIFDFNEMSDDLRNRTTEHMKSQLRTNLQTLEGHFLMTDNRKSNMRRYEIEFHRKFALSFSIVILFFIGAPLGAIVKRGGFGAPVVIAALLFMIYYVIITIGDEMARSGAISPFAGMWMANFILTPFAILLMYSAAHDGSLAFLTRIFKRKKKNA